MEIFNPSTPVSLNYINAADYGLVPGVLAAGGSGDTIATANLAAMQTAYAAALAANKDLYFPGSYYEIYGAALTFATGGITIFGERVKTVIAQRSLGVDVCHVGQTWGLNTQVCYGLNLFNLNFVHLNDQAAQTRAIGLSITGGFFCRFVGIVVGEFSLPIATHAHYSKSGIETDPANPGFSNWFEDISIKGFSDGGFRIYDSSGSGGRNFMIVNGELANPANRKQCNFGMSLNNMNDGAGWGQINIEWGWYSGNAMYIGNCKDFTFDSVHFEGCIQGYGFGFRVALVQVHPTSTVTFNNITAYDCTWSSLTPYFATDAGIFQLDNDSNVTLGNVQVQKTTLGGTAKLYLAVSDPNAAGGAGVLNSQINWLGQPTLFTDAAPSVASLLTSFANFMRAPTSSRQAVFSSLNWWNAGGLAVLPDTNLSIYGNQDWDWIAPTFTAQRTITLLNAFSSTIATIAPPGTRRRFYLPSTAAFTLVIKNAAGTTIDTIAIGASGGFTFNGTAWIKSA